MWCIRGIAITFDSVDFRKSHNVKAMIPMVCFHTFTCAAHICFLMNKAGAAFLEGAEQRTWNRKRTTRTILFEQLSLYSTSEENVVPTRDAKDNFLMNPIKGFLLHVSYIQCFKHRSDRPLSAFPYVKKTTQVHFSVAKCSKAKMAKEWFRIAESAVSSIMR